MREMPQDSPQEEEMKIGIDIDGVICDTISILMRFSLQLFGRPWQTEFHNGGFSQNEMAQIHDLAIIKRGFLEAKPYPDTEIVKEWAKKHQIFFITSRQSLTRVKELDLSLQLQTKTWLDDHDFKGKIIFDTFKDTVCRRLKLHLMVEDDLDQARKIMQVVTCCLIDRPWNRGGYVPFGEYDFPHRIRTLSDIQGL